MKNCLLMFALALLCHLTSFAQSFTGEMSPCPFTTYPYKITYDANWGTLDCTAFTNGIKYEVVDTHNNGNGTITFTINISWQNYSGQGLYEIAPPYAGAKRFRLTPTIRGLADIQFTTFPGPQSCSFQGNVNVGVNQDNNATKYEWSSDADWINDLSTTRDATFYITTPQSAYITVKSFNANCGNISKTNNRQVQRTASTTPPVFSSADVKVCAGGSATISVTSGGGSPVGYEWYAVLSGAGSVKINGGTYYGGSNILSTIGNSVTLTDANTAGTGITVTLYSRAVYSTDCKSPWATKKIDVGQAGTLGFRISGSVKQYGYTDAKSVYNVCKGEELRIQPLRLFTTGIIAHRWEVVSGQYDKIGVLNGDNLLLTSTSVAGKKVTVRYQYQTSCGWSTWQELLLISVICTTNPGDPL